MLIHRLANGATVLPLSPEHGFKFPDGTSCGQQDTDLCDRLTLTRLTRKVREVKRMDLVEVRMLLSEEQKRLLAVLGAQADLVLVAFPVLAAMREQGIRDKFPNVVAFNATPETQRAAPSEKIVDIRAWSY